MIGLDAFARLKGRTRALLLALPLALVGTSRIPWTDLVESDWIYGLATRFARVEGHRVHYPTPPAELAKLLEARQESAALRHLAEARLELGDREGALTAMARWAQAEGAQAWEETARWAAAHHAWPLAFQAADKALPGLDPHAQRALADLRITWAIAHPDQGDALALRKARAELFPRDAAALEDWIRALERAKRLDEADAALAASRALEEERKVLLRSDLQADHEHHLAAYRVLDEVADQPWSPAFRKAYAARVRRAVPNAPAQWRTTLDRTFDEGALVRLATCLQGQSRGADALDLLRQVERRHEATLGRPGLLLLARLYRDLDAIPEAFRARLAAAHAGDPKAQLGDLAGLAHLALDAGGRPLALGTYNDEAYQWAARVDRTPGFWTGGVSFLLTGLPWQAALERLEMDSLPDRTFATARALAAELARRAPQDPELPDLRLAIMERHVARGEGREALALLPLVEGAGPAAADEGRRIALLAMRQVEVPLQEEVRLMTARLHRLAPDGSQPWMGGHGEEASNPEEPLEPRPWARRTRPPGHPEAAATYRQVLDESIARLGSRDPSNLASLGLILAELDRLPGAEGLWLDLASRLEAWNLDDDLGPRYERALARFKGPGLWPRLARWYARRSHTAELRNLADGVVQRFRASEIFSRIEGTGDIRIPIPEQPAILGRTRMVAWADWVRFKALERFPHSPAVFSAARGLVTESQWAASFRPQAYATTSNGPVVVPDRLMEERSWALFFLDPGLRDGHLGRALKHGTLEAALLALEQKADRNPVENLLLFEGWCRLSQFERAFEPADRLQAAYPGDGALAQKVLALHRSLSGLSPALHAERAQAVVARSVRALEDPDPLWTGLGELEEERGRPDAAQACWQNILARDPRNAAKIAELATLLWDYNHDAEALAVVEAGRKRLDRPRFFAFETGVLRENLKDADGAVREYLDALRPEGPEEVWHPYEQDQRSLRRLAQLLARPRVFRLVTQRIQALKPGAAEDEQTLTALAPLARLTLPPPSDAGPDADWIDTLDQPNDPDGRAGRARARDASRPLERDAVARIGDVLLAKLTEMVPRATATAFLEATEAWGLPLLNARGQESQGVSLEASVLARKAELAPHPDERIRLDMARATFLAEHGRVQQADAVWAALEPRISGLPEGAARLRAEAARAGYLERAKGKAAAAAAWRSLGARHAASLGLLEDRLAFLARAGQGDEARTLLEDAATRSAAGYREGFLERLTTQSLAAGDLERARRAVGKLLAEPTVREEARLGALHLFARLNFRRTPGWKALATAQTESTRVPGELQGDLYAQLARAADLEGAHGAALPLWIEALNRKTDPAWLRSACLSAKKAGKADELLGFFEQQQKRSPRDVRWAVAVRDIRRDLHQVAGAIEAARNAVAIRPEREDLWREAADLMVRGDRTREAADFLEGWQRPRQADEGVARWRSDLYARAGDPDRALAVEMAALEAFQREAPRDRDGVAERKARAAERLRALGLPGHALRVYSKTGDIRACLGSRLPDEALAQLALLTDQFQTFLTLRAADPTGQGAAAVALRDAGRPEQREAVLRTLLGQILPPAGKPDLEALNRWWPFLGRAGLEPQARLSLAERHLAAQPGPWQAQPPLPFVQRVAEDLIGTAQTFTGQTTLVFRSPDLPALWARDLARRDRPEELVAFLEPRWRELVAQVAQGEPTAARTALHTLKTLGTAALLGPRAAAVQASQMPDRMPWTAWMDDPAVLATWARGAAQQPEKRRDLEGILASKPRWERFWALAARGWNVRHLGALVSEETRLAWYRLREPEPPPQDPVLVARRKVVDQVALALEHLLAGAPRAGEDPRIAKLRGPQTVGEVLGGNAAWTWPEFRPRGAAETGEDRVTGSGADAGRLPGALWGERPGDAWYVLETLARYRNADPTAPLVPLDAPARGGETDRLLLAMRLARRMNDLPLALELERARPGALGDRRRLENRVALLMAHQERQAAEDSLRAFLTHAQAQLNEATFLAAEALAKTHGLPPALDLLDPDQPVGPAFLAFLVDRRKETAARFRTGDPAGFRAALAARWAQRDHELTAAQLRTWLHDLWAQDAAGLPRQGLRRLGGIWPHAAAWLERQPPRAREAALQALETLRGPEPRLFSLLDGDSEDSAGLLAVRARLARGEPGPALARVDAMLAGLRKGQALGLPPDAAEADPGPDEAEADPREEAQPPTPSRSSGDPLVDRLLAWIAPFQEHKQTAAVEARIRAFLQERREAGPVPAPAWRLAFRLAPKEERPALAEDLDAAWFRGDVPADQLGAISATLAQVLPGETARWLGRWPLQARAGHVFERVEVLAALHQREAAATLLYQARGWTLWRLPQEVQAFDRWRRLGAPAQGDARLPRTWRAALPFWTAPAEGILPALATHLQAHPGDVLASRAALRTPSPAPEAQLFRAAQTLDREEDRAFLALRAARFLLPTSWRAASAALGSRTPEALTRGLEQRRIPAAEVQACVADLARLAHRRGDPAQAAAALALLEDRKAPVAKALKAEFQNGAAAGTDRHEPGRPAFLRPRDLTWDLLTRTLTAEGAP